MKLQHLAIGARFEYEGLVFVKTGPLTASSEEGGQRIIPRYAILKPLDVPATEASKSPVKGRLEAVRVRTAFERFYESCERLVPEDGRGELAEARQHFFESIK
ncbi:MAG: hypothetical protein KA538_08755 [Azonexus sp.]|jgi:hypothetical protein|nr:hypothetical protein [Azonexus sp.]